MTEAQRQRAYESIRGLLSSNATYLEDPREAATIGRALASYERSNPQEFHDASQDHFCYVNDC